MYQAGYYTSKKELTVVKSLATTEAKGADGKTVTRIYGLWAMQPGYMIKFKPNEKVYLDAATANLPNVKTLIQLGIINRTY